MNKLFSGSSRSGVVSVVSRDRPCPTLAIFRSRSDLSENSPVTYSSSGNLPPLFVEESSAQQTITYPCARTQSALPTVSTGIHSLYCKAIVGTCCCCIHLRGGSVLGRATGLLSAPWVLVIMHENWLTRQKLVRHNKNNQPPQITSDKYSVPKNPRWPG